MSEGGARTPGNSGKHLQTLEPMSQPSSDGPEEEEELEQLDAERETFVDAQDSHADEASAESAGTEEAAAAAEQEPPARSFSRDARAIIAPISNYLKSQRAAKPSGQDETTSKWQRRIESALIKMNAEIAALREQLDMQQEAAMQSSSILPGFLPLYGAIAYMEKSKRLRREDYSFKIFELQNCDWNICIKPLSSIYLVYFTSARSLINVGKYSTWLKKGFKH